MSGSGSTRPPMPSEPAANRQRQQRALGVLAIIAALTLVRIALPFAVGLFLGALLAFTLQPIYGNLRMRHWAAGPAALVCALGATLVVGAAVVGITVLFVSRSMALLSTLPEALAPGGGLTRAIDQATLGLARMHVHVPDITQKLQAEAVTWGARAASIAAQVAEATFAGLLAFFFMSLSTFFVLRHWSELVRRAEELLPFERRHTHELLTQFRKVGRQVLLGTLVTGIIQGCFAAVGYELTGVAEPGFWGVVTAMASLVPAVGTLLIWVPIGIYKIMTGHVAAGLIGLVYNTLTVGIVSDYVIRPRLVGHERGVPTMLTFIALFGGVEVFGIVGLVLGPVLVTLSVAILRTYQESVASSTA